MSTKYNILYNGHLALENGKQAVNNAYKDNYWNILPIERMQISEEIIMPGQSKNQDFERAEEKAIKAVQKHGMNIGGKEKNPQIDEAYLLLGKARYFDQRFIPALEAFNYILYKYPTSDKINQAKIWREKTNIRLDNNELAISNLKRLLEQEDLKDQDLADATSMLAQAYINSKVLDSAVWQLNKAAQSTKSNDERGRYRFIQGQLYNKLALKDSANWAFNKVIALNRKTPRAYLIAAHLEKARNVDALGGDKLAMLELLHELKDNRENRPYLGAIYYEIAQYHLKEAADSLAVAYYNKSLRTNSNDKILIAKDYENLGDIAFDFTEYKKAGAYYDSTLVNMALNSKPYRIIKRKRDNLSDVIYYEDIAAANDSILGLVAMTPDQRMAFFESYTETLKTQAAALKEEEAQRERNQGIAQVNQTPNRFGKSVGLTASSGGPSANSNSNFYFYNQTTVAYGKNEFRKNWGNRELKDNWRWASINKANTTAIAENNTEDEPENALFNPEFYVAQIPSSAQVIDSMVTERNRAYYQLGVIYKEKFKEYALSKSKFQALLALNPDQKLVLPTKYNLYKLYQLTSENAEAEIAKNDIISNYPESRYAAILKNPEAALEKDASSPESVYANLYQAFQDEAYQDVVTESERYLTIFEGEPIVPKMELLKAQALGRLYGFEAYSKALNFVAYNYANTQEGQQAQDIIDNLFPKISSTEFVDNPEERSYKIIYPFQATNTIGITEFVAKLEKETKQVNVFNLSVSVDFYTKDTSFVVVHGLRSKQGAMGYAASLEEKKKNKIIKPHFAISSSNYATVQIHKNVDAYLAVN
ncbi:tetratricopeptide repeat protein [Bizionia sediminis]|uniref:Tetratricopeptide repeat protein n=1 Tax=Bizionia sediminis TaxID=1737064 RepID=A0ABW5KUG3_9FLAO